MTEQSQFAGVEIVIAEDSLTQAERLRYYLENTASWCAPRATAARRSRWSPNGVPPWSSPTSSCPRSTATSCRRLRADAATADLPVILLTALSESADVIGGLASGATDFVGKPCNERRSWPAYSARWATASCAAGRRPATASRCCSPAAATRCSRAPPRTSTSSLVVRGRDRKRSAVERGQQPAEGRAAEYLDPGDALSEAHGVQSRGPARRRSRRCHLVCQSGRRTALSA